MNLRNKKSIFMATICGVLIGLGVSYTNCGNTSTPATSENTSKSDTMLTSEKAVNNCGSGLLSVEGACYKSEEIVSNAKNPFDYVGKEHNYILQHLRANLSRDPSLKEVLGEIENYGTVAGVAIDMNKVNAQFETIVPMISKLKEGDVSIGIYPAYAQSYIKDVFNLVRNTKSSKARFDGLLKIEDQILNARNLKLEERNVLLGMLSVTRHSNYYWVTHGGSGDGEGDPGPAGLWWVTGLADGFGFVLGSLGGPAAPFVAGGASCLAEAADHG